MPPETAPLVEAEGVTVRFGRHIAVEGVHLAIRKGEVVTLVGPNGSGKTTLVRTLLGLIAPAAGRVRRRPGIAIGYVPQHLQVDATLPIDVRRFLGLGGRVDSAAAAGALPEDGAAHNPGTPGSEERRGGEEGRYPGAPAH